MDIEQKQADLIEHFVKQVKSPSGAPVSKAIVDATSHPLLFTFSEILSLTNVAELQGTEYSVFLDMLQLFSRGTCSDYKSNIGHIPALLPDQVRKLKQLSVLTLAETNKVLSYDQLMQELDVSNVREFEDFVINDCMHVGIVRGKLNQLRRCFEVQCAAGRDLRPGQLGSMIEILSAWLTTSDNLLVSIQDKIKWADTMGEAYKKHKKEIEDKVEEKKSLKADMGLLGHEEIHPDSLSLMELRTMKKIKTNPSGGVLCNLNDEARGMEQFGGLPVDMLDFCSRLE
ncbi:COP9 signalosome complex subunit 7-like isoform X3 [Magnolia sinica]|uniref:COP9 signalosome complex subunit 7-like isoform X3 n=1 Tax=Magnolia sinica TaxID=86752 RepID=UPI002658A2F1|nr:COP9 signalosome complex subunit 7-like isoform X3 [Magnolia sinica]